MKGWLFDAYPVEQGITLWVIDAEGRMHTFLDPWEPRFFVRPLGNPKHLGMFLAHTPMPMN